MKKAIITGIISFFICFICAGCGGNGDSIHVSADGNDKTGDGSPDNPYATVSAAVANMAGGEEILVHEGTDGEGVRMIEIGFRNEGIPCCDKSRRRGARRDKKHRIRHTYSER